MSQAFDFSKLYDRNGMRKRHPVLDVTDRTVNRYESQGLRYIESAGKHWYTDEMVSEFLLTRERRRNPPRRAA